MKESLAARQAALLRQNAELDQKVEAIEQRRQQQLQTAKATSGSSSRLPTKHHELSAAELSLAQTVVSDDESGSLNGDVSDAMSSPERANASASRLGLVMNLSASVDAAPGKAPGEPEHDEPTAEAKPPRMTTPRRKSMLKREQSLGNVTAETATTDSARKPLRRHKTGLPKDVSGTHEAKGDAVDSDGLGLEATVRYQKARLRVLQDELDTAQSEVQQLHGSQQLLKASIDELADENATLRKKYQHTQLLLEKQQELSAAQESKQKILETQLAAAQTKVDELQKAEKQASQQFRSKDIRLNRALEELEKVKAQLQEERRSQGEQSVSKAEHEHVVKENKRLEKQKSELLLAFKKQMKLIDLLKRQRIHMEAAKMLSFTEEEFSKTLELG